MKRFFSYMILAAALLLVASVSVSAQNRDSLWIAMANDSSLVIRPVQTDTVPAADSVAAPELVPFEEDILLARQDSILKAEHLADSLRQAREDSVARVLARVDGLVLDGEDCMSHYAYAKAIDYFSLALSMCPDPVTAEFLKTEMDRCRYAISHTESVPQLDVVARQQFSIDDFFLYYPLPDKSWHEVDGAPPMFLEEDRDEVYVSRDFEMIYQMTFGNRMYFSSKSLDGFGGYDLYCSEWDEKLEEWGEPENMGFPYSSAGDDFLFSETADGRYFIFASNRDCEDTPDSVYVYVVERGNAPATISNPTARTLEKMARLEPKEGLRQIDNVGSAETSALDIRYREIVEKERDLRHRMESADSEEHPSLQAELDAIKKEKARVETEMLERSSIREKISDESNHEVVGIDGAFLFTRKSLGKKIKVVYN